MIDCKDERILELAEKAVYGMDDDKPLAKAKAMQKFTNRFITNKNFSTAFASASEVARLRGGDCSEHAVLLCACGHRLERPVAAARTPPAGWHPRAGAVPEAKN